MRKVLTLFLAMIIFVVGFIVSEKKTAIANATQMFNNKANWDKSFNVVNIENQKAYFHSSISSNKPLLVSLHSWSADYTQTHASLSKQALDLDWNYIHPDFEGMNNHPNACGSPLVVKDIDNAIDYAINHGHVDKNKIYIVGESGGGYATLLSLMQSRHNINTFVAWVPISDLDAWYQQSLGRNQQYAKDILTCTNSVNGINTEEAKKRSPLYMATPKDKLLTSKVKLFTGIHDGYSGSVPITHTLNFYNKLAKDMGAKVIEKDDILYLLEKQKGKKAEGKIQNRDVHFHRQFGNVEVTVFEGGHEMLEDYVFQILQ